MFIAVRFWGGGVTPEFPRGTGAVARGLSTLLLYDLEFNSSNR
jgi:hypothetical protein